MTLAGLAALSCTGRGTASSFWSPSHTEVAEGEDGSSQSEASEYGDGVAAGDDGDGDCDDRAGDSYTDSDSGAQGLSHSDGDGDIHDSDADGDAGVEETLLFHSGFEPNSSVVTLSEVRDDIVGQDLSVLPPNSWTGDLEGNRYISSFNIFYGDGSGDSTTRGVELVADPEEPSNHVLRFWILRPNDGHGTKGRIQTELSCGFGGFHELNYSVRLYLPRGDFEFLMNMAKAFTWFTVMEFWNHSSPVNEMFRMTVDLQKPGQGFDWLRFGMRSEIYHPEDATFERIIDRTNTSFLVPVGKWMTLKIDLVEGDEKAGYFFMSVTPDGEQTTVLFDEVMRTYHPDIVPNGIHYSSPLKLYTYDWLINALGDAGRLTQLYWDDLAVYASE